MDLQKKLPVSVCLNQAGNIVDFNEAAEKMYGCKRSAAVGKAFFKFSSKQDIPCPLSSEIKTLNQDIFFIKEMSFFSRHSKEMYLINWSISQIFIESDKIYYLLIGINLKQAEDEENYLESYIENIINNMPHFIVWKDKDSRFLGCNKKFADAVKIPSADYIVGKNDYDMPWSKEQSDLYIADDLKILSSHLPKLNYEETQKQADGSEKTMLVSKVPLYDNKKNVFGVLAIYTDITERKKMENDLLISKEKAEASSRAKTEFIANMSHDIRTPLAGMAGLTDMLEQKIHDPEDKQCIQYLKSATQQLLNLLNGVLDMVSADSNQDTVKCSEFSFRESINRIEQLFLPALTEKNIKLVLEIDSLIPEKIITDEAKVERIILNLMSNGIKFTKPKGTIAISARYVIKSKKNYFLEFSVKDNGIGIPKNQQDKIFEGFYKINPSYEGVYRGHGVGLYIVKKFLDLLGGKINVKSTFGKGTEFICLILLQHPVIKDDNDALTSSDYKSETAEEKKDSAQEASIKALIVEDDAIVFFVEKKLLQAAGCKVDRAATGQEALELAQKNQYDFILMDIGLPDISGIEVTQQLRQIKKLQSLPIIGLTAHAGLDVRQACLEAGMNNVITKPLENNQIKVVLKSINRSSVSKR